MRLHTPNMDCWFVEQEKRPDHQEAIANPINPVRFLMRWWDYFRKRRGWTWLMNPWKAWGKGVDLPAGTGYFFAAWLRNGNCKKKKKSPSTSFHANFNSPRSATPRIAHPAMVHRLQLSIVGGLRRKCHHVEILAEVWAWSSALSLIKKSKLSSLDRVSHYIDMKRLWSHSCMLSVMHVIRTGRLRARFSG